MRCRRRRTARASEHERGHDHHGRPLVEQAERPGDRLGQVAAEVDEPLDDVVLEPPQPRVEAQRDRGRDPGDRDQRNGAEPEPGGAVDRRAATAACCPRVAGRRRGVAGNQLAPPAASWSARRRHPRGRDRSEIYVAGGSGAAWNGSLSALTLFKASTTSKRSPRSWKSTRMMLGRLPAVLPRTARRARATCSARSPARPS